MEWHVSSQCIYKVDWLLPLDLSWDSCNNVLKVKNYSKDLDVLLAIKIISICYFILSATCIILFHSQDSSRHIQKLFPLLDTTVNKSVVRWCIIPQLAYVETRSITKLILCTQPKYEFCNLPANVWWRCSFFFESIRIAAL